MPALLSPDHVITITGGPAALSCGVNPLAHIGRYLHRVRRRMGGRSERRERRSEGRWWGDRLRRPAQPTTDKLTDPQIVAKVKEHYGIDR